MSSHKPTNTPLVREFMTGVPSTVDEGLSLSDAQERMYVNNIRHLVVTRGPVVAGVLSTRDISLAQSLPGIDVSALTVANAMVSEPYTCTPDTPLVEVAEQMEGHRYGCAIVVDNHRPIGMFTTTDALRALRQMITGEVVTAAVKPTHVVEQPRTREKVEHHVRAGDELSRSGTGPSPNQGKIL